jgi:hypothetical protein
MMGGDIAAADEGCPIYGRVAAIVGVGLFWFAIWTVTCNALILAGFYYPAFLWALLITSILTGSVAKCFFTAVVRIYAAPRDAFGGDPPPVCGFSPALVAAIVTAALAAAWTQRTTSPLPYLGGTALTAMLVSWTGQRERPLPGTPRVNATGWQLTALFLLLVALYYFSHRADGDDANFVNLAIGAQRTTGSVYQFDTMLGDGPGPIHLPTYKFHSFEILGAVISSITGLEPIAVLHLVLPLAQLALLPLVLFLTLSPVAGGSWLAAALLWAAFLFLNETTLASWGVHGIIRLFQGKAFLVSALVPLIVALTVRWFRRGERVDLFGLCFANICAIGFSANGLYGGPLASGFVAAAFVASAPQSRIVWRRVFSLIWTVSYPALIAALIILFGLALPSEVAQPIAAVNALCFVATFGMAGHIVLALIALGGVGFVGTDIARVGLTYVPLTMLLTLNPISWTLLNAITGNLGFRVFWSLPAASMSALTALALFKRLGLRSERGLLASAAMALVVAVGWNIKTSGPMTAVQWHEPDLKVNRDDYDLARRLVLDTHASCRILAPEHISTWLTTIRGAPYPVFARELYLIHYRFTMPATERALRERLRLVVDGTVSATAPSAAELTSAGIPIGIVAVDDTAPSRAAAESLARNLGLNGPARMGSLLVWSGDCSR